MKILLVEDDHSTLEYLTAMLTANHYLVDRATDGQLGMDLADQFDYDLVLLDVMLPKMDGLQLCQHLRARGYQNPILLLTAMGSPTDRVLGLDSGADDYLIKPFAAEELLARIRAVTRRGRSLGQSAIHWENICLNPSNNQVTCDDRLVHLTPKEYGLLELFLLNPDRIFNRAAILDRLWDFAEQPGEETVSTHIKCIRQKLKAAGAANPIETVHGLGYRLRPALSSSSDSSTLSEELVSPQSMPKLDVGLAQSFSESGPIATQQDSSLDSQKEQSRQQMRAKTAQIWLRHQGRFLAQVQVLDQSMAALRSGELTLELQQEAKQAAHKLAGALGLFGLMDGSHVARELESWLQPTKVLDPAHVQILAPLIRQLQQTILAKVESAQLSQSATPLLLIVEADHCLAEQIYREAIAWGLQAIIVADLDSARQIMQQNSPRVVLLDVNAPDAQAGLQFMSELKQGWPDVAVLALTGQDSLEERLLIARAGGCRFLQKSLKTWEILKAVTDVLNQHQVTYHNRILVVDDDAVVPDRLSALLNPLEIEVIGLNQPAALWESLVATQPNLLLLDLELPGFSGVDLCQAVRNDPQWQHLEVVFLSNHAAAIDLDQAFVAGADDYISKTVTEVELAARIVQRLRRVGYQGTTKGY